MEIKKKADSASPEGCALGGRQVGLVQWFLNLFYITHPLLPNKQGYEIYPQPQYTQWCSFLKNTKVTNPYS